MTMPRIALTCLALTLVATTATARPPYFDTFTSRYGLVDGDDTYACGNCHYLWNGTGSRNPYGSAVEQQLYLGKSVVDSLIAVENQDSDGDGFSNLDEIATFRTLPGYSCDNFTDAVDAPIDYHTFITPGVASCLEPHDIRVIPQSQISLLTFVGQTTSTSVDVYNNGTDEPLVISSYGFLDGSDPALSLDGPPAPLVIPVGQGVSLTVEYTPTTVSLSTDTLRIESDDPDEPVIDLPLQALGLQITLAPAADREACLSVLERQFQTYAKRSLREWSRCYSSEAGGSACDAGRRDQKLLKQQARMKRYFGGSRDRLCKGSNLNPSKLGLPSTCGGGCGDIVLNSIERFGDCLICRRDEAIGATLGAASGAAPPDLPTALGAAAERCQKRVIKKMGRVEAKILRALAACELANVTAPSPVDCAASLAVEIAALRADADGALDRCGDTTGMAGCRFEPTPDPSCLGDTAASVATELVAEAFGLAAP
jgi:hypothetical protein